MKISFSKKHIVILAGLILSVITDQISKMLAVEFLQGQGRISIIPHIFDFFYVTNRGAAFGMLSEHRWIFIVISSVAIVAILAYSVFYAEKMSLWYAVGLSLIAGGGIGNMIDRVFLGYVVDFIEFAFVNFATFNIADSCVCIGAVLVGIAFLIDIINDGGKRKDGNNGN